MAFSALVLAPMYGDALDNATTSDRHERTLNARGFKTKRFHEPMSRPLMKGQLVSFSASGVCVPTHMCVCPLQQ